MKVIAIDYDRTYTADPTLWKEFIKKAKKRGHKVVVATMRFPEDKTDSIKALSKLVNRVIFTCKKAKKPYLEQMGIYPDIWIDDLPEYILKDKKTS